MLFLDAIAMHAMIVIDGRVGAVYQTLCIFAYFTSTVTVLIGHPARAVNINFNSYQRGNYPKRFIQTVFFFFFFFFFFLFVLFVTYPCIFTGPTMRQLHQHVIPNIAAHWRKVAEFLELKISTIDLIDEKCKSDPTRCCEETFREWLKTDNCGVGPKNWSTLIAALKGIRRLKSVAVELYHELSQTLGEHL